MAAPMSRDDADGLLAGLGATHDRIAAAMYAIDVHPAMTLLHGATLTGATERRWRALSPEVDALWAGFTLLGQILDDARTRRASVRPGDAAWDALTRTLREPVIELGSDGLPVAAGGPATTRLSLGDFAPQLEQRCAAVSGHLSEVESASSAVSSLAVPVTTAIDAVVALGVELGEPAPGQRLAAALADAGRIDLCDPLAAAPNGRPTEATISRWAGLADEAAWARSRLGELAQVRQSYPQLRSKLDDLVRDVATMEEQVAQAQLVVAEKIADPGLAAPPDTAGRLRVRLARLDELHSQAISDGQLWRRLVADLSTVEQAAEQARDQARQLRATAEGLLARRDELRGRLAAYRAKAAARGLAEDAELTALHTRAQTLLFMAPCDLRASTKAVYAYQQRLAQEETA
jgi:hypothetical protein